MADPPSGDRGTNAENWSFDRANPEPPMAVYVDAAGAEAMGTESTRPGTDIWADWGEVDRATVEHFFAHGLEQLRVAEHERGVLFSPDHRSAAVLQSVIAELVENERLDTVEIAPGVQEARYDNRDSGWVQTAFGLIREKLKLGRFDWARPADPVAIPDDLRIAILGDWGSGRYGAPRCAESIVADTEGFDVVVHLGDVYYSGTTKEVKRNFLYVWPWETMKRGDRDVLFRACNSNHEMYSGGKPYRELTLRQFNQPSSAFALENSKWLLVGLDTAFDEWKLAEGQDAWLRRLLARSDGRRAILFSHHQPLSHLASPDGDLVATVDEIVRDFPGKVHAWYWGHEHLAAIYDRDERWRLHGRCVGHSGFPYFRDKAVRALPHEPALTSGIAEHLVTIPKGNAPRAVVVDGANEFVDTDVSKQRRYGPNGYMILHLSDDGIEEELRSARGELVWSGVI